MTTLWIALLDQPLTFPEAECLAELLPPERRARLPERPERREGPLCAYGLLTLLLRESRGWERLPDTARTLLGKPWFPAFPQVQFSLSHTDGAVLAAVSNGPVGADIQRLRPLSERMLGLTEGRTAEEFWRSWCRREALAKRDGTGGPEVLRRRERPLLPGERCLELDLPAGFAGAAAFAGEAEPVRRLGQRELLAALGIPGPL